MVCAMERGMGPDVPQFSARFDYSRKMVFKREVGLVDYEFLAHQGLEEVLYPGFTPEQQDVENARNYLLRALILLNSAKLRRFDV